MLHNFDTKLLDRYRKIARLAAGGDGGEQANAKRMLDAMAAKHLGLSDAVRIAEVREATEKKMHDAGFAWPGAPDDAFFEHAAAFTDGLDPDADHSDKTGVERLWWQAMGWAVDKLKEADFRPPPPAPAPAPEPPKSAKAGSVKRRLYEETEIYDAFVGDSDELGEIIEVHFAVPSDLWAQCVRSKTSALILMKLLEKRVAVSEDEEDEFDDDDDTSDEDED